MWEPAQEAFSIRLHQLTIHTHLPLTLHMLTPIAEEHFSSFPIETQGHVQNMVSTSLPCMVRNTVYTLASLSTVESFRDALEHKAWNLRPGHKVWNMRTIRGT